MRLLALGFFALLLVSPLTAFAGGCPTCMTDQDCVDQGGPADSKCVQWFQDFGCGKQRIACCPGQGCALQNGEPSCIMSGNCELYDAPVDGGPVDTGVADDGVVDTGAGDTGAGDTGITPDTGAQPDSGGVVDTGPGSDTGAPSDTGSGGQDTGAGSDAQTDAGNGGGDDEGCGCTSSSAPSGGFALVLGVLALVWRRRSAKR